MANHHSSYNAVEFLDVGGYDSAFETDTKKEKTSKHVSAERPFSSDPKPHTSKASSSDFIDAYSREEGKIQRHFLLSLDAYSRHKKLINDYFLYHPGATEALKRDTSNDKTDLDVLKENHKFLWDESDEDEDDSWEKRLARKYYDKLFKEYCIADLSRYKENKTGMRWRIAKEVVEGKGQFICGSRGCSQRDNLTTWEVNFGYIEHNEKKNALVKLRLCKDCSFKLNYHRKKKKYQRKTGKLKSEQTAKRHKKDKKDKSHALEPSESSEGSNEIQTDSSNIWTQQPKVSETEEKSKTEEMDEFLEDMFL